MEGLKRRPAGAPSVHQGQTGSTRSLPHGHAALWAQQACARARGGQGKQGRSTHSGVMGCHRLSAARATRAAAKAGLPMGSTGPLSDWSSRQWGACRSHHWPPSQEKRVAPKVPTTAQHGGSEHTGAPHTRRRIGRHGSCDEARRAQGEPGGPSARWGWPQAGPAQKGVAALWGWEGRVRRPAPAPHAAQASRGVLGVLCSQGVWAGGGEVALSGQGRASWRASFFSAPFQNIFVR
jgi:hypothetical protein